MSEIQDLEQTADKWFLRLRKDTVYILLFLSLANNVWQNIDKRNAENNYRSDLKQKDFIIAQKEAAERQAVRERDQAQQKTIETQDWLLKASIYGRLPHGDTAR